MHVQNGLPSTGEEEEGKNKDTPPDEVKEIGFNQINACYFLLLDHSSNGMPGPNDRSDH